MPLPLRPGSRSTRAVPLPRGPPVSKGMFSTFGWLASADCPAPPTAFTAASVRAGSVEVSTVVTASTTTATVASARTERRSPERSGSASRMRFVRALASAARWRASWAARSGSASAAGPSVADTGPSVAGTGPSMAAVSVRAATLSSTAVASASGAGPSPSRAVQRRENQAMPTRTTTSAALTSSSFPYEVSVSACHVPTCRHDWYTPVATTTRTEPNASREKRRTSERATDGPR